MRNDAMNKEQRKEVVDTLRGVYPRLFDQKNKYDKPKKRLEVWNNRLKDWDYDKTMTKLNDHIDNSPYEPKIYDIKPNDKPEYMKKSNFIDDWEAFEAMFDGPAEEDTN